MQDEGVELASNLQTHLARLTLDDTWATYEAPGTVGGVAFSAPAESARRLEPLLRYQCCHRKCFRKIRIIRYRRQAFHGRVSRRETPHMLASHLSLLGASASPP